MGLTKRRDVIVTEWPFTIADATQYIMCRLLRRDPRVSVFLEFQRPAAGRGKTEWAQQNRQLVVRPLGRPEHLFDRGDTPQRFQHAVLIKRAHPLSQGGFTQ